MRVFASSRGQGLVNGLTLTVGLLLLCLAGADAASWFRLPRTSRASCFVRNFSVTVGGCPPARAASCAWISKRSGATPSWLKLRGGLAAQGAASSTKAATSSLSLNDKLQTVSKEEEGLFKMLVEAKQEHLFQAWPEKGSAEASKHAFFKQVAELDKSYPGGVAAYIRKARSLLGAAVRQENPFEGMTPSVPEGETLTYATPEFVAAEERGLSEVGHAAFVIVAGGLGERLGYQGIKLALPVDTLTGKTYLEYYVTFIRALQARAAKATGKTDVRIPLVIMTSDDTDKQTRELLEKSKNFGMAADQITIVKQDKVPALKDSEARLATVDGDAFTLDTKPHGHGDVHHLLLRQGLTKKWSEEGRRWVFFLQDTNALVVNSVLPTLGISAIKKYDMNSICIPRKAGEASGAITKLTDQKGASIIINVEYNQLDPLLRSTTYKEGDVNDPATGFSPFPGNANNLVFYLPNYHKVLQGEDQGVVTEFVNPKFKDSTRTAFTKATRLECMMQDFPKLLVKELGPSACIGFTSFDKWLSFSPAKNSLDAGAKSVGSGVPPATASSAEMELYRCNARKLSVAGAQVQHGPQLTLAGVPLEGGPQVVLSPFFALTVADLAQRVGGLGVKLSGRSSLVLSGEGDVSLQSLDLDGTLVLDTEAGAKVTLSQAVVANEGDELLALEALPEDRKATLTEADKIRGYVRVRRAGAIVQAKAGETLTLTGPLK